MKHQDVTGKDLPGQQEKNDSSPIEGSTKIGEGFDVKRSIAFRIVVLLNHISRPFYQIYGKMHDLSIWEWRVMMVLAIHPGISANEICRLTGLHKMNVSRAVRRLLGKERIRREVDPKDRRRKLLWLSENGLVLYHKILPGAQNRELLLRSALSTDEQTKLDQMLDRLISEARGWRDNGV